jgi:hypothetical protein
VAQRLSSFQRSYALMNPLWVARFALASSKDGAGHVRASVCKILVLEFIARAAHEASLDASGGKSVARQKSRMTQVMPTFARFVANAVAITSVGPMMGATPKASR